MSVLNVAITGLNAAKQALTTTSHNIANANNPAYSRQEVVLTSVEGAASSSGIVGRGVAVQNVRRLSNDFLDERISKVQSELSFSQAQSSNLNELDRVLSDSNQSLTGAMDSFFQAAQDLSVRPNDDSLKDNLLFAAESLATRLNRLQDTAQVLTAQTNDSVRNSVENINRLTEQIARLNIEITDSTSVQGNIRIEPNDLIDQRAQLIKELSAEIEVQAFPNENGRISLNTRLGTPLVSDGVAFRLDAVPSPDDGSKLVASRTIDVNGVPTAIPLSTRELGQSRLGGLLAFRDRQLDDFSQRLEEIGQALVDRTTAIARQVPGAPRTPGQFELFQIDNGRIRVRDGISPSDIPISSGATGNDLILQLSTVFASRTPVTGNSNPGASIEDMYRGLVSQVGNRAAQAKSDVSAKEVILTQLEGDKSAFSGVSLDEEAANLIRYQQSYSAAGKVIALSRDLFQELLDAAGN